MSKLSHIARQVLTIDEDLPFRFDYSDKPHPRIDDFDIYIFEQIWGSTALGFGGVGGQAMTSEYTYVFVPVTCNQKCFVYFVGRFAYAVPYSEAFMQDVMNHRVEPAYRAGKYTEEVGDISE